MKTLVFITSQFPFGKGETFIEAEFPYLEQSFNRIIIIAQNATEKLTRKTNDNVLVKRWNPASGFSGILMLPFLIGANISVISTLIREELSFRKSISQKTGIKELSFLLRKIIKAIQLRNFISSTISREGIKENIVFYSYWLKTGAHAISLLNYRNSIKVSRAHGSDLYEEKTEKGYLPLLNMVAKKLDAIIFISRSGLRYLADKTGISEEKLFVSYLGTENDFYEEKRNVSQHEIIVSCSNLIPLKRVHLIIEALHILKPQKDVLWVHFGDGILRSELEALAAEKLSGGKIKYMFMGHKPNDELLRYYFNNNVVLFINTSSTEGVPVSIMEAQSAGIPVVATSVGGVPEIVVPGTGSLIPVDFRVSDLAEKIQYYLKLEDKEKEELRKNAVLNWRDNFNAPVNYTDFVGRINAIFASRQVNSTDED